ncbi:MAG TPA: FAD-binding oxidoreductase [Caulobacteraceae bacterium]|nr:FAD-binding oxidoreductase [Caulobacteraceae bacterium]
MNRRTMLQRAAATPLALSAPWIAGAAPPIHRPRPGQPGWPEEAQWEGLKRAVGGRLLQPLSPYGPCLQNARSAECAARIPLLRNPFFLGDQPGGTEVSGWLGAWTPHPSAYAIAAENAADIAAGVDFARRHNLRLVVKGGAHSYQGTSNAPDSLLIWTRPMNRVELVDAFVPAGCAGKTAPRPAVKVDSGAMWIDVYHAVTTIGGRYAQGGGCTTVGVAGHVQSGGFGSWSKGFGLAAGSLLEAEVVTADGRIRLVNACQDPDLFWALKGGGGGSFGVVTRLTLATHDLPATFGWAEIDIKAGSDAAYRRLIEDFMAFFGEALRNPHWGEQAHFKPDNTLSVTMVSQGLDGTTANDVWRPFLAHVGADADLKIRKRPEIGAAPARGWWDVEARRKAGSSDMVYDDRPGSPPWHGWWKGDGDQASAFLYGYDSVWLPASLLASDRRGRLSDALFAASRHFEVGLHFNKGLAGAGEETLAAARDTAMNPAAVDAFALAIIATGGAPPLPGAPLIAKARADAAAIDAATAELAKVVGNPGSYVAESNYFNRRWADAFWGQNYPRLQSIKARYDPTGLFFVRHQAGSEAWSDDGFTRLA